ncbi:HepT-like ribonuclease domain-containing protein [Marinobacter sp. ELB17]|uniref:HepT-like ribonuclease domain-containing protein n=1 Tax=Marinobacter sp. ELB17 TaxID=270374 RepID=UPI0000F3B3BD|nr:HepT-like ribonuclease domain-containing protein [Marinobacter sp. ELB17]EAZ98398.1 hypothetical protein MELB17_09233 [Marinobacter sp. ELB17]
MSSQTAYEARRQQIKRLMDEHFNGNEHHFASAISVSASSVGKLVRGERNITENAARHIEQHLRLPPGSMDTFNPDTPLTSSARQGPAEDQSERDEPLTTYKIRKNQIEHLIHERFAGNQAEFGRSINRPPSMVWQWLNDHRNIGEKAARKIEMYLKISSGALDTNTFGQPLPKSTRINSVEDYLKCIERSSSDAESFIKGFSANDFSTHNKTRKAVSMCLLEIGDAASSLTIHHADFISSHPDLPWATMLEMKPQLGCLDMAPGAVWETATTIVPKINEQVGFLLDDMDDDFGPTQT